LVIDASDYPCCLIHLSITIDPPELLPFLSGNSADTAITQTINFLKTLEKVGDASRCQPFLLVQSTAMLVRSFQANDEEAVIELWHQCDLVRPVNNPRDDIRMKLKVNPEMFLVGILDGKIVASVMAGYEGHRGWINYLAVHPDHQRKGFGRVIVAEAERLLEKVGCPKINLQVRTSNKAVIEFYKKLGYSIDDVIGMGKRLKPNL
jgi:GNAT superfamily N-acetyltransferase